MKKYNSIGELLIEYRKINSLSQSDFAANVNVDIRTVRRWEQNISRVTQEKEEEIVMETLLPYQLILNLNAFVAIPTYYDFELRKYSLTSMSKILPKADWFKDQLEITTKRIRIIDFDFDIRYIIRFLELKNNNSHLINRQVLYEGVKLLPELNLIITDDSGYYAGHSFFLPITLSAYEKLKDKKISKEQLTIEDLANYKTQDQSIFFNYDTNADCNDNFYYMNAAILTFFHNLKNKNYIFSFIVSRSDNYEILQDAGLEIIWEQDENHKVPFRFWQGNFVLFLSS